MPHDKSLTDEEPSLERKTEEKKRAKKKKLKERGRFTGQVVAPEEELA